MKKISLYAVVSLYFCCPSVMLVTQEIYSTYGLPQKHIALLFLYYESISFLATINLLLHNGRTSTLINKSEYFFGAGK